MRFIIFTLAALLLPVIAIMSCIPADNNVTRPEISVISKELKTDENGKTILSITVKNTGRNKADLAEVTVKFFDANKNLLDSNRDSVMTLNPGETWEFKISCSPPLSKVASYEIETMASAGSE